MKIAVIYSSIHHKNTEKVAHKIAESIGATLIPAELTNSENLSRYDLIGIGSGVYYGKFHQNITKILSSLTPDTNKNLFLFVTSGIPKLPLIPSTIEKNRDILIKRGFNVLGILRIAGYNNFGFFKSIGGINKGHPNQRDFKKAEKFAKKIKKISKHCQY